MAPMEHDFTALVFHDRRKIGVAHSIRVLETFLVDVSGEVHYNYATWIFAFIVAEKFC